MKRLFIATPTIEFSSPLQDFVDKLKSSLRNEDIVWVEDKVRHLTLRFIGATPDQKVPPIMQSMDETIGKFTKFSMKIDKTGVFGSRYEPKVIWLGFGDFSDFKRLYDDLESRLEGAGFEPNYGNFVPHITLGRIKRLSSKERFWKVFREAEAIAISQEIEVSRINLYQSFLNKDGPEYKVLFSKELQ